MNSRDEPLDDKENTKSGRTTNEDWLIRDMV